MPVFDLKDANAGYNGRAVLSNVSLRVEKGERVGLVGRSGAGKSTLLALLYSQRRRGSALIPQDPGLVKTLSVFHNIFMGRLHRNGAWYNLLNLVWPMHRAVEEIQPIAARLGLEEKIFEPAGELSGGQQQRTAVGRALYQQGDVVLGDEPVSAVDGRQARTVLDTIAEAHETVVLAMHDVDLAVAYTDRIVGLNDGRVVLDAPSSGLTRGDLDFLYER
ncbi:MAG: phosphonate ABC transporter ATP-binding protein [Rhodospirillales bacterium]